MKLGEIARRLGCHIEGQADVEIRGLAGIEGAQPGQLTFVSNPRYRRLIRTTRASALLVGDDVAVERGAGLPALAVLRSANAYLDFARAVELFHQPPQYAPGVHPTAVVSPKAQIGAEAHIGPYCFIDDGVHIGRGAVLHSFVSVYRDVHIGDSFFAHSHVSIREGCQIGHRVILQNGVIVGGDGFGFAKQADGSWYKIPQAGITVLEDDVEVQSNTCIDRATLGETRVGRGVKLDDLVLVGHGSTIGPDTLMCGQVGLAGTTEIGKGCLIGGQVGCSGHISVGDGSMITPQSGVPQDVPAGVLYSGSPVVEHRQWLKNVAAIARVPELAKAVRELQAEVAKLRDHRAN